MFVLLGTAIGYLGSFFGIKKSLLGKIGGIVIILLGMHLLGVFKFGFLNKDKRVRFNKKKISYFGSFLVGVAFAFGWTPCVGPILSSILVYASSASSLPRAAVLLFFYSLGIGVPFIIAGILINQFLFVFNRFKNFVSFVPKITGVFLIFMGLLLFLGLEQTLRALFRIRANKNE